MQLNLIFVPKWLEIALKASQMSLGDVTEPEKIGRILSSSDLEMYRRANEQLHQLVSYPILQSFVRPGVAPPPPKGQFEPADEEAKRAYLYGNTSSMYEGPLDPVLHVHRIGYDYVILTVGDDPAVYPEASDMLMDALLKHLYAVTPLNELAALPLFKAHLDNHIRRMTT